METIALSSLLGTMFTAASPISTEIARTSSLADSLEFSSGLTPSVALRSAIELEDI